MELIVTSFLLIALLLVGDIGSLVADQLRRPRRRVFRLANDSHEPPPSKRAPIYSPALTAQAA